MTNVRRRKVALLTKINNGSLVWFNQMVIKLLLNNGENYQSRLLKLF